MDEADYIEALTKLREDWGSVLVDGGVIRAEKDPTTGMLIGMRAKVIAEIVNRALDSL